ncbi:class I fructose-bisphosphate aldolase [Rubrobacter aplysinae]|uniref:class I fructose-bisphosphate aldolase n=1 Tax=Rubrobacter aplysinae TaxID=909625 RepID=UPI00064C3EAA|nr:class I fructose-bisphosphate aldolase [Rubrobacter aplysinae]
MEAKDVSRLEGTAREMVAPRKGILAADESYGTINKRFTAVGIEDSEDNRRAYREMLFTADGVGNYLSGVIMFDETIRQKSSDGRPFAKVLEEQGVLPGIKVDQGAKDMALSPGEKLTEGLDGLRERLAEYVDMGARFTKWRAVITIDDGIPTRRCIDANAHVLARYAALVQEAGMVPIVEPEVLIDGTHSIDDCYEATLATLHSTFDEIHKQNVEPRGLILKPNMVISGKDASNRADVDTVARYTLECLLRTVPAAVPGIAFLSGGQSDREATAHLDSMNRQAAEMGGLPWEVTFSYARALQDLPMRTWKGDDSNASEAQRIFLHRAKMNSLAHAGEYDENLEESAA